MDTVGCDRAHVVALHRAFVIPSSWRSTVTFTTAPQGVGKDDLLDAAVAAWTALRRVHCEAACVCTPEWDGSGLEVAIWY